MVEVSAIGYQQDTNQVEMAFISFFFFSACLTYAVQLLAFWRKPKIFFRPKENDEKRFENGTTILC